MSNAEKSPPFYVLLLFAVVITYVPLLSVPFNWLESFFHELSHGLAAIFSGGKIISIQLFTNGAGLCTTQGGNRFFVSFMGYSGAIIWGSLLYLLASAKQSNARLLSLMLMLILSLSIILWVRDLLTLIIVLTLIFLFYCKWKIQFRYARPLLQLTGLLVLLNAVLSPLHLIDGRNYGDGASLAALTAIPEIFWVIIWSTLGCITLIKLGKKS